MENRCEGLPEKKSLIGNGKEFENDARLNREGQNGKTEETV